MQTNAARVCVCSVYIADDLFWLRLLHIHIHFECKTAWIWFHSIIICCAHTPKDNLTGCKMTTRYAHARPLNSEMKNIRMTRTNFMKCAIECSIFKINLLRRTYTDGRTVFCIDLYAKWLHFS